MSHRHRGDEFAEVDDVDQRRGIRHFVGEHKKALAGTTAALIGFSCLTVMHDRGRFDHSFPGIAADSFGTVGSVFGAWGGDLIRGGNSAAENFGPWKFVGDNGLAQGIRSTNAAAHNALDDRLPSYRPKDYPGYQASGKTPPEAKPTAKQPTPPPKTSPFANVAPQPKQSAFAKEVGCINKNMSIEERLGQKIIAGFTDKNATRLKSVFNTYHIGGAIAMGPQDAKGYDASHPIGDSIKEFKAAQDRPIMMGVDQEGGSVQRDRMRDSFLSAQDMAQQHTPAEAQAIMTQEYKDIKKDGFTTAFAPDLDLLPSDGKSVIGPSRLFGKDASTVNAYGKAYVAAGGAAGIATFGKHFPDMGSADRMSDTHPSTTLSLSQLKAGGHLTPYKALSNTSMSAMVGSAKVPGLTHGKPANQSRDAVNLLRELGYEKKDIVTDDLATPAINLPIDTAMVGAWEAGIDMGMMVGPAPGESYAKSFANIIQTGKAEIAAHRYSVKELNESVARIDEEKHLSACG